MGIPFFTEIERLIVEHGSATVLKERLALLKDQFVLLERKVAELEAENAQTRRRNDELERQLAAQSAAQQFEDGRGALFKKRPGGGYVLAVYCPVCRQSAGPFPPGPHGTYACDRCQWFSNFTVADLQTVMSELP